MTLEELYCVLCKTGYPAAYEAHVPPAAPPYIIYEEMSRDNVLADDKIIGQYKNIRISLFTTGRDLSTEEKLANVLDDSGIIYDVYSIGSADNEKLYEVDYEIQIWEEKQ